MSIANLAAALVKAQTNAKAVEKTSKNRHMGFSYASSEAVIAEGREALSEAGLAFFSTDWRIAPPTHEGATPILHVKYVLVHGGSGESMEWSNETPVIVERGRGPDKAAFGALSYSLGYTLRGLLLLPREEEGTSVDARDDRHHEPAPRQQAPTPPRSEPRAVSTPSAVARIEATRSVEELMALWKELSAGKDANYLDGMKAVFGTQRTKLQKEAAARAAELAKEQEEAS